MRQDDKIGGELDLRDRLEHLRVREPLLTEIFIETAYSCNMKCSICDREGSSRESFMPMEVFSGIVSELRESDFQGKMWLHYAGEPLMHPHLETIARIVNEHGFSSQVLLVTNGLLLDRKHVDILRSGGIANLIISLHGTSDYMSEYCSPRSYEKILRNLKMISAGYANDFDTTVHCMLYRQEADVIEDLIGAIEEHVNKIEIFPSLDQLTMKYLDHPWFRKPHYDLTGRACPFPWESMVVLTDGTVNLCCFNNGSGKIVDGLNVRTHGVQGLFHTKEFGEVREQFCTRRFRGHFDTCGNCSAWKTIERNPSLMKLEKTRNRIWISNGYVRKCYFGGRTGSRSGRSAGPSAGADL
jgi:pyruvate-formate lyase-activating enzyme